MGCERLLCCGVLGGAGAAVVVLCIWPVRFASFPDCSSDKHASLLGGEVVRASKWFIVAESARKDALFPLATLKGIVISGLEEGVSGKRGCAIGEFAKNIRFLADLCLAAVSSGEVVSLGGVRAEFGRFFARPCFGCCSW